MEKRVDEKILDFINAAEEKEARKDIYNGPVKINERYYEFEETEFFDEKLKMYIPKNFEDMPLEARKLKYPSENRPEIIKCNEDGSIAVTLKVIDSALDEEHVKDVRDFMKSAIQKLNPANIFFEEGVLVVEEKHTGYFDFKSSAIDDFLYNFVFLLELSGNTLMGTFSCSYDEHMEWKDVLFPMANSIKVIKEETSNI